MGSVVFRWQKVGAEMLALEHYDVAKNVHVYRQGGLNIAYDVNSGSLHVLDDLSALVLEGVRQWSAAAGVETAASGFQQHHPAGNWLDHVRAYVSRALAGIAGQDLDLPAELDEELDEVLNELADLQRQGTLFSPEVEEVGPAYPSPPLIKAICLHVAHDCNLRCEYCFAGAGAFGGSRGLMDAATGKKAIDFLLYASRHRQECEVDFFGGEPLLNFAVVRELVRYGKEAAAAVGKRIKFTLTTNALLLDSQVQEFLAREDISVVLSLDGRPEVHDRMRPYVDGSGSYAEAAARVQEFVARRPEGSPYAVGTYYYVRGTYTHFNLDFDRDVLHLADLGIKRISLEPVVAGPEDAYAFRGSDLAGIHAAYDRLGEELLSRRTADPNLSFFHFNVALDQGPCLPKRLSGCGAGHEYVAISPEGDIYPCHQFVGRLEYKMGSLHGPESELLNPRLVEAFREAHVFNKPACRKCWARFACSGGCHAANTAFTGTLTEVYELGCELQRKRLEVALYLKVREAQRAQSPAGQPQD